MLADRGVLRMEGCLLSPLAVQARPARPPSTRLQLSIQASAHMARGRGSGNWPHRLFSLTRFNLMSRAWGGFPSRMRCQSVSALETRTQQRPCLWRNNAR